MSQGPARSAKIHFGWRGFTVSILAAVGVILAVVFMLAHWSERQLLTTDNWVALVAPLPKNDKVATALSNYSVGKLFNGADVELQIKTALPDRVAFIAPALTDELQARTTKRTKQFIQSDRFSTAWTAVNRAAHARLMERARHPEANSQSKVADFAIKLGGLADKVRSLLGKEGSPTRGQDKAVALKVSLNEKVHNFGRYVRLIDFVNATVWLAALASLLGAFVFARQRRRLLLVLSATFVVIALLQLIGVRALRPWVLNHVEQSTYRPAVEVVYNDLVANFRHSATLLFIVSAVVFLVTYFTQRRFLAQSRTVTKQLKGLDKSSWLAQGRQLRQTTREYHWQISGAVAVLGLIMLAFVVDSDWQGLIRGALAIIIAIEIVHLVAGRAPRSAPM